MAENKELSVSSQATIVEWKIRNFFNLPTNIDYSLDSPPFSLSGAKWHIRIYPNGRSNYDSLGWLGLYFWKERSAEEYRVAFRIGIVKDDGSVLEALESEQTYLVKSHTCGRANFLDRSVLLRSKDTVGPEGHLTAFCNARIVNRSLTTEAASQTTAILTVESASQTASDDDVSPLSEDFRNLYISKRCTDVTLIVKNEEFYAHRAVLAARSPVFASMFELNLSEKTSGKVEISDSDPSSFEKFLVFLYTKKLDDVPLKYAMELYKTSHKYEVKDLKEECVRIMRRDLCVEFFCDVICLAVMYGESDLLKDATNFFVNNVEAILPTTKWQQFLEENSSLCNELLMKLVKSKK